MKSALVIIDVQNHFVVDKAASLPAKIVKHIQDSHYDHILFTTYHNVAGTNFRKILQRTKALSKSASTIHPQLAPFATPKNTFKKLTYSAFKSPGFVDFLKKHKITDIFLCGINIDGCVLATAFEAFDLGFNVEIIEGLSSISSTKQKYEQAAKTIIARNLKHRL